LASASGVIVEAPAPLQPRNGPAFWSNRNHPPREKINDSMQHSFTRRSEKKK
jgi:hypothetical protein